MGDNGRTTERRRYWNQRPSITLDAAKIKILQKLITRKRQPWMRWIERRLISIADNWNVEEAMVAKPSRQQRKQLNNNCLTENTLNISLEIGGEKQPSRYITTQPKPEQKNKRPITTWESGFGVRRKDEWTSIEKIKSKLVYQILMEKRSRLREYTPNKAHRQIFRIHQFITSEERSY